MSRAAFGLTPDGRAVEAVTLRGPRLTARVLTLGATVQDLRLEGVAHPLVLGFPTADGYFGPGLYAGALVGRFANRLGGGRFTIDGRAYQADRNERGRTLLHGGTEGIHHRIWTVADLSADRVTLTLELPDGHMGFPGKLTIRAEISVAGDALAFDLRATTDAPTLCNLAHHGYFALDGSGDARGHLLQVAADHYLPVDADLIPTGEVAPVTGTRFDFRQRRDLRGGEYDHNLCLGPSRTALRPVATLTGRTGLRMEIETTEPGLQLYDGRHFDGVAGLVGLCYGPHAGVALETQGWPDAPNHPGFPDAVLRPGQEYRAVTRYRFGRQAGPVRGRNHAASPISGKNEHST